MDEEVSRRGVEPRTGASEASGPIRGAGACALARCRSESPRFRRPQPGPPASAWRAWRESNSPRSGLQSEPITRWFTLTERPAGIEPAKSSLARRRRTPGPRPHGASIRDRTGPQGLEGPHAPLHLARLEPIVGIEPRISSTNRAPHHETSTGDRAGREYRTRLDLLTEEGASLKRPAWWRRGESNAHRPGANRLLSH